MSIKSIQADFKVTEQKIDKIRASNLKPNEVNPSVFTSTLKYFINNVGMQLPHDSDPGFYKDHYDREVKARQGLAENDDFYVSKRVSARGSSTLDNKSDDDRNLQSVPQKNFNVQSGFTSQMTTLADGKTTQ